MYKQQQGWRCSSAKLIQHDQEKKYSVLYKTLGKTVAIKKSVVAIASHFDPDGIDLHRHNFL